MRYDLIARYDYPAPRYTSYPAVPYWDTTTLHSSDWIHAVRQAWHTRPAHQGLSLYIHLPYCEQLCTYCACNTRITRNHAVEKPYLENILREWMMYVEVLGEKPVLEELHLGGGTPTFFSPAHLHELLTGILQHATLPEHPSFSFEGHPANTTGEHLEVLYALSFRRISLGVQDFNAEIQHLINRKQTPQQVETVTQQARDIGYESVNFDLVYGLPRQTEERIRYTIEEVIRLQPDRIAFYSYAHVPWMRPGQRAYDETDLPQGAAKRKLYETGRMLLEAAGYIEIGLDHFAWPGDTLHVAAQSGKLHRNFMGYTERATNLLIGLGASAISDADGAFAQNYREVEAWADALQKNDFALFRGHLPTAEDTMIRRMILELMCQGKTAWSASEDTTEALCDAREEWIPFLNDGLVTLEQRSLIVNPDGYAFLRNICACLDARLRRNKQSASSKQNLLMRTA